MYNIERPARIKSIYAEVAVTTTAGTTGAAKVVETSGLYHVRVRALTDPIYVSPLSTAPLTSNSIKLSSSSFFDLISQNGYVALYSTSTGGSYELVLYQD